VQRIKGAADAEKQKIDEYAKAAACESSQQGGEEAQDDGPLVFRGGCG
jgi:hypothetical protein